MSDPNQPQTPPPAGPPPAGPPAGPPPAGPPAPPSYGQPGNPGADGSGGSKKLLFVIAGAIVALVVAVVLVVVLLKALGGGSPEAVTEDYLDAQWNSEFEDYCELQAKEYRESTLQSVEADDCADFAKKNDKEAADRSKEIEKEYGQTLDEVRDDFDRELEVTDVEEDGDKATVTYEERIEYTGDNEDFVKAELGDTREETHEGSLELVKEDGDWKVSPPTSTTE